MAIWSLIIMSLLPLTEANSNIMVFGYDNMELMVLFLVLVISLLFVLSAFYALRWRKLLANKSKFNLKESIAIWEALPVGIAIYDKDGYQQYVNEAVVRLFGLPNKEEHLKKHICFYEDMAISDEVKEKIRRGEDVDTTLEYDLKQASDRHYFSTSYSHKIYLEGKARFIRNAKGEIIKLVLILYDIAETVITRKNLEDSRTKLSLALEAGGMKVWSHDLKTGKIAYLQKDYTMDEGEDLETHLKRKYPEDIAVCYELIEKIISGKCEKGNIKYRYIDESQPDGFRYCESYVIGKYEDGKLVEMTGAEHDISYIHYYDMQIAESRKKTALAIKASNMIQWNYDCERHQYTIEGEWNIENKIISKENFYEIVHPDDIDKAHDFFAWMDSKSDSEYNGNMRVKIPVHKDWQYVNICGTPVKNCAEIVTGYTGFMHNDTNWVKLNNELRTLNQTSQLVFDNINSGLVYVSKNYVVQWVNVPKNMKNNIFPKYKVGELCYKSAFGKDSPCTDCLMQKVNAAKLTASRIIDYQENRLEITSTPVFSEEDKNVVIGSIHRIDDISEKMRIMEKLADYNRQNQLILNNINSGLVYLTPDFKVVWENVSQVFPSEYTNGKKIYQVGTLCYKNFSDADVPCSNCVVAKSLKKKEICHYEIVIPNGRTMEMTGIPLFNDNGEHEGTVLRIDDVTECKRINHELVLAKEKAEQSDVLKSAFLANMSHEIRTPLNAIIGFSELLKDTEDAGERAEYWEIINTNNKLLLRLISDILDLSKIESGMIELRPEEFDMSKLFKDIYSIMVRRMDGHHVELIEENPYESCMVTLDKNRVSQVEMNFVTNSIKYTSEGQITMGYEYINDGIKVYVKDTGIGIAKEKHKKLFQRFEKLDDFAQGTGLGLSICKAIVHAYNGDIGFESEEGKGSFFWAWFPCYAKIKENGMCLNPDEEENKNTFISATSKDEKPLKIPMAEDEQFLKSSRRK